MAVVPLTKAPVEPTPEQRLRLEWATNLREELEAKGGLSVKAFHRELTEAGASVTIAAVYAWLSGQSSPSPLNQAYCAHVLKAPAHRLFPLPRVASAAS